MARFTTLNPSSLRPTVPNYGALIRAIEDLSSAEVRFYRSRRDELNDYPGQITRTLAQIESAYDALLGTTTWTYSAQLNNSGNSLTSSNGQPAYYVRLPAVLNDVISADFVDLDSNEYLLYSPGAGQRRIDLLFTNIAFFGSGSSGNADDGFDDDPTSIVYQTGFGELPVAYESNSQLSGRVAQTLYVAGTEWDSIVRPAYNDYIAEEIAYVSYTSGSPTVPITEGPPFAPWAGYRQTGNSSYNRPERLSEKLVEEARGYN